MRETGERRDVAEARLAVGLGQGQQRPELARGSTGTAAGRHMRLPGKGSQSLSKRTRKEGKSREIHF